MSVMTPVCPVAFHFEKQLMLIIVSDAPEIAVEDVSRQYGDTALQGGAMLQGDYINNFNFGFPSSSRGF